MNIERLNETHIPELYQIITSYNSYFDDKVKMDSPETLSNWMKDNVIEGFVGTDNGEVIGCGYLNDIHKNFGEVSIFVKRRSIPHNSLVGILRRHLKYYFDKYNLKMIYAVVAEDNKACMRLLKELKFTPNIWLTKFETINGKPVDCIMYCILKEELNL